MPLRTPLYEQHLAAKAKMVDFAGWQMPINYGSQLKEHQAVREHAGMFDVSHMTIIDVQGEQAKLFLQTLLANDVDKLQQTGKALYSAMLNEQGGVIDDLIVYLMEDGYRLVVNSATREKDVNWLNKQSSGFSVSVTEKPTLAMIAVQGPQARVLTHQALKIESLTLSLFQGCSFDDYFIARTGYTGEDGYEIIVPEHLASQLWLKLKEQGVVPCGLGARDTLRLEAGMNLYGNDMNEDISPLAANMAWTVANQDGRSFIGASNLDSEQGQLVGLILSSRGIMRAHQTVCNEQGKQVGEITSGSFSPTLQHSIAMARIKGTIQSQYHIDIRGKLIVAQAVTLPFVRMGKAVYKQINN